MSVLASAQRNDGVMRRGSAELAIEQGQDNSSRTYRNERLRSHSTCQLQMKQA